jgi:diguanylate cyclase (GGDEF)-like protein/PAS domain S-box-containing protein
MLISTLQRYIGAVVLIGLVMVIKQITDAVFGGEPPLILFLSAVMVIAQFSGIGPGLVATGLAVLVCSYFYFPPECSLKIGNLNDRFRVVVFLLESVTLCVLMESFRAAKNRAEQSMQRGLSQEDALRESEARFRLLVENVMDYAIIMLDPDGRVVSWNTGAERIKGYRADEIIGRHFSCFYPAEDVQSGKPGRELAVATAEGRVLNEGWRLREDGSRFFANVIITALRDDAGRLRGFSKVTRDISEQKRSQASQARLVAILDSTPDFVVMADASGQVFYTNRLGRQMVGRSDEDISRMTIFDYHPAWATEIIETAGIPTARKKGMWSGEIALLRRDGSEIPVSQLILVHKDSDGDVQYLSTIARDITEQKRAEEILRRAHDVLEVRVEERTAELVLAYDATIEGWSRAMDLRDKETEGHTRRVTEMTLHLAKVMGMGEAEMVNVRRGALLHDIGKMGIPDSILLKPGPLTDEEWEIMRRHPGYAYNWLSPILYLRPALAIPYGHHEKWDGTGYPRGLAGEQIPLAARIFAAVDIWDALRKDRPYRRAWPEEKVRAHIASLAGTHLDPAVVDAFLCCLATTSVAVDQPAQSIEVAEGQPAGEGPLGGVIEQRAGLLAVGARFSSPVVEDETAERLPSPTSSEGHAPPAILKDGPGRELEVERVLADLRRQICRLVELVATDDLTGLKNRRHFCEALEAAFSFAVRQGSPFSIVMLDVDHFKAYNDAHGHFAGDEVLRGVAAILVSQVRTHDVVARHGGEEFAILLPATGVAAARVVAEQLRAAIAGHDWPLRPVRVSVGVATMTPTLLDAAELMKEADQALYQSKSHGRNRVTHHDEVAESAVTMRSARSTRPLRRASSCRRHIGSGRRGDPRT